MREHLKSLRKAKGYTAQKLGELCGIKEEKVYQVERGRYKPTEDEAVRWAKVLGVEEAVAFPQMFDSLEIEVPPPASGKYGEPEKV